MDSLSAPHRGNLKEEGFRVTRSGRVFGPKFNSPNDLADSTSKFRERDLVSLNIYYEGIKIFLPKVLEQAPSEIYISDMDAFSLENCYKNEMLIAHLPRKERTLAKLVSYVLVNETAIIGTQESRTDSFVDRILRTLEFDEDPLMLQLQPLYKFLVYNKSITSQCDFGVTKKDRIMMVDEDKHLGNTGPSVDWGEYQIAGEVLAGICQNYHNTSVVDWIYAIRVIGTKFTFYKSKASESYIRAIASGFPQDDELVIYRYPDIITGTKRFHYLDFRDPEERRAIVNILLSLRESMLT